MRGKRQIAGLLAAAMICCSQSVCFASETLPMKQGKLNADLKRGDVNNDGSISGADITEALRAVNEKINIQPAHVTAGDLDGDKTLSVRDALMLLQDVEGKADYDLGYENKLSKVENYIPESINDMTKEEKVISFPGAEGFGKYVTGGRGGRVIEVTNLNDKGPGSLRAAIDEKGPRIIVFKVSGVIHLESGLGIRNGDVTIAGQTAPGDGITLAGNGLGVSAENVIIRYIRVHKGDQAGHQGDGMDIKGAKKVIVDHCSVAFGTDENLSATPQGVPQDKRAISDEISVQWCMITESIACSANVQYDKNGSSRHGMGSLIVGAWGAKISYHHNFYTSHSSRVPNIGSNTPIEWNANDPTDLTNDPEYPDKRLNAEFFNNVVYNWDSKTSGKSVANDASGKLYAIAHINYINNTFKTGPMSTGNYMFSEGSIANHMYASGNCMNGVIPEDQMSLVSFEEDVKANEKENPYYADHGEVMDIEKYPLAKRFSYSYTKDEGIQSAADSAIDVEEYVGCSLSRDKFDEANLANYADGTKGGLINHVTEAAGWTGGAAPVPKGDEYTNFVKANYPHNATYPAYVDSDHDGISDEYEKFMGLNANDPADGAAAYKDNDKITNLEVFLQFLVENPEAAIAH